MLKKRCVSFSGAAMSWSIALGLAVAAAGIFWFAQSGAEIAPELLEESRALFVEPFRDFISPEARERNTFYLSVLILPFLIFGAIKWAERLPEWNCFRWVPPLAGLCGGWIFLCDTEFCRAAFPGFGSGGFWAFTVIGMGGFCAGRYFSSRKRSVSAWIAALILTAVGVTASSVYDVSRLDGYFTYHFNTVVYALSHAASGAVEHHMYGFYPEFLAGIFLLLGGCHIFTISLVMAVLRLLLLGLLLWTLWRCSRHFLTVLGAGAALILFFSLWGTLGGGFDPYFEYHPVRTLGGAVLGIWLFWYWRNPSWKCVGAGAILSALTLCWNLDGGVAACGGIAFCLLWNALAHGGNVQWKRGLFFSAATIAVLALCWCGLSLWSGGTLALADGTKYQRIFLRTGFYLLPMTRVPAAWCVFAAVYVISLTLGMRGIWRGGRALIDFYRIYWSIWGIGLFAYYQGRSHPNNLMAVSIPAILLVFLEMDHLWRGRQSCQSRARMLSALFPLLLFGMSFGSLALYSGNLGRQFGAAAAALAGTRELPESMRGHLAFLRRSAAGRTECNIWGHNQGLYYAETGFRSPIPHFNQAEIFLKSDRQRIFRELENSTAPLFLHRPVICMGFPLPEKLLTEHYRLIARSPDGEMLYFEPRKTNREQP